MSDRERAFLYGILAGLICYAAAIHGAHWERPEAAFAAACWTTSVYYVTRKSQGS